MLETIVYTLPCVACVLWALIYCLRKRTSSQNYYWLMLIIGIFYFLTYSFYVSPNTDYRLMVHLDIACQPFAIFLLAMMLFYIETHLERQIIPNFIRHFLFLPPLFHLGFVSIIYYLLSFEEAAALTAAYDKASQVGGDPFDYMPEMMTTKVHRLYMFGDVVLYSGICAFYSIMTMLMCVYSSIVNRESIKKIGAFFTKGNYEGMVHLVNLNIFCILFFVGPLIAMGRSFIYNHPVIGATMSICIAFFISFGAYVEFVGESFFRNTILNTIKEKRLFEASRTHNEEKSNVLDVEKPASTAPSTASDDTQTSQTKDVSSDDTVSPTTEEAEEDSTSKTLECSILSDKQKQPSEIIVFNENIDRQFIYSMEVEKIYTDSSLTIDSLAQKLKTNRSTLSALVNKKYGMTFKTLLATYRIAFAKQYMLENPNISVDDVAEVSGFGDRSSFFHKFKEMTGMSPKVWLTKQ